MHSGAAAALSSSHWLSRMEFLPPEIRRRRPCFDLTRQNGILATALSSNIELENSVMERKVTRLSRSGNSRSQTQHRHNQYYFQFFKLPSGSNESVGGVGNRCGKNAGPCPISPDMSRQQGVHGIQPLVQLSYRVFAHRLQQILAVLRGNPEDRDATQSNKSSLSSLMPRAQAEECHW